jgi:hypothetical protein
LPSSNRAAVKWGERPHRAVETKEAEVKSITLIAAIAALTLVPTALADTGFRGSPDAIDRAVAARQAELRSGFEGSPDAIDRAVAARRAQLAADFDRREHPQLELGTSPDVVDRAVTVHRNAMPDLSSMPDVLERTAAAGQLQYQPATVTGSGFDWGDFGMGAGAGIGLLLLLGIPVGVLVVRGNRRMTTA